MPAEPLTSTYDAGGQLEASVNPLGKRTSFTYDDAGRRWTSPIRSAAVDCSLRDAGQVLAR
jgi:YD repeat-containing protein